MSHDDDQSGPAETPEDPRLVAERRRKLDELRANGFAYPNQRRRTALAGQIVATYQGHDDEHLADAAVEVSIGGRLMVKRVMGKASVAKLQDRTGQIQIFVPRDCVSPVHSQKRLPH